jgi:hypothetical protein
MSTATAAPTKSVPTEDHNYFMKYDFERIPDDQKHDIAFNDGELAFTLRRGEKIPVLTTALFRSATSLNQGDFRAAYPVKNTTYLAKVADVVAVLLRAAWQERLDGYGLYNDGEIAVQLFTFDNGEEGIDALRREDTTLDKEQFLHRYPVTRGEPISKSVVEEMLSKFFKGIGPRRIGDGYYGRAKDWSTVRVTPVVPHFTLESVLPLLSEKVTRVPLTDEAGLLTFSDKNDGTAALVHERSDEPLATLNAVITEKMRQEKCTAAGCSCDGGWDRLFHGHMSKRHSEYLAPYRLYAELCQNPACEEQHVWVIGACVECEDSDMVIFQLR